MADTDADVAADTDSHGDTDSDADTDVDPDGPTQSASIKSAGTAPDVHDTN